VLGGTGFLGANIVRALLAAGYAVRVLSRSGGVAPALEGCNIERVSGDLRDTLALEQALRDVWGLVHSAGAYPLTNRHAARQAADARAAMRTVVEAARRANVARIVYTSSYATVGRPHDPSRARANETDTLRPGEGAHAYFAVKQAQEDEALAAAATGLPIVVLLPTACFGPYDARPTSGAAFQQIRRLRPAVYFRGTADAIDVRDVADAHVAALERGRSGERYLIGHVTISLRELTGLIARSVGVRPPQWGIPPGPALVVARILEALDARGFVHAPPFLTGTLSLLRHFTPLDCSKARRELCTPARPLDQAIQDEAEWLAAHDLLT
jgi:dihydroflavonol-4-reductase